MSLPRLRLLSLSAVLWVLLTGCHREPTTESGVARLEQAFSGDDTNPSIRLAIAAAKTNDLGLGVIALQGAKQSPSLSAEQMATVEQAAQVLTAELVRRATTGDLKAKADLDLIERSRSQ